MLTKRDGSVYRIDGSMLAAGPNDNNDFYPELRWDAGADIVVDIIAQHPDGLTYDELWAELSDVKYESYHIIPFVTVTTLLREGRLIYMARAQLAANQHSDVTAMGAWLPHAAGVKINAHGLFKLSYDEWIKRHAAESVEG